MNEDIEQMTLKFLKENDSAYFSKRGKKSKMLEYPYQSDRVRRDINSYEIPLSNLSNKQRMQCPQFGDSHNFEEE